MINCTAIPLGLLHYIYFNPGACITITNRNLTVAIMTTKFLYFYITISMMHTVFGREYVTETDWMIGKDANGLYVLVNDVGTCITTGTYSNGCALPADVLTIPLIPLTTSTPIPTVSGPSGPNPSCVLACATQTCPGYATSTDCFCSRVGDIGYCMAGDCGIPYQTATVLAEQLCCKIS